MHAPIIHPPARTRLHAGRLLSLAFACQIAGTRMASGASLVFSGLIGGGRGWSEDAVHEVAIDRTGHLYVVGETAAEDFPVSQDRTYGSPDSRPRTFVAKLSPDGSTLLYATLLGGASGRSLAVTDDGQVWLTGLSLGTGFETRAATQSTFGGGDADAFVARLDADGRLALATWLGGSGRDLGWSIRILDGGDVAIAGSTSSTNFPAATEGPGAGATPALAGSQDGFLCRLGADGRALRWTVTAGGAGRDNLTTLATRAGSLPLLAAGQSNSETLPGARSTQLGPCGGSDAWVMAVDPATGTALWTSRVGGTSTESAAALAVASDGSIGMLCQSVSTDLPAPPGAFRSVAFDDGDAWLVRLTSDGTGLTAATHLPGRVGIPLGWPFDDYPYAKAGLAADPAGRWVVGLHGPTLVLGRLTGSLDAWESMDIRGSGRDTVQGLAVTGADGVVLGGGTEFRTRPPWFPTTPGSFQRGYRGSVSEGFVAGVSFAPGAPPNDRPENARAVTGGDTADWVETTTAGADVGEPAHAGQPASHSVWWQWTAPTAGRWIVDTAGSSFDTVAAVYRRTTEGALEPVAANDDQRRRRDGEVPDDTRAHIRLPVQAGERFLVAVDGKNGASGAVQVSFQLSTAPSDDPDQATPVAGYGQFAGSNLGATLAPLEPPFVYSRHAVWWRWTAPETGGVEFMARRDASADGVTVGLFDWPQDGALTAVGTANGASGQLIAEAGRSYWVGVDTYWGETGSLELQVGRALPPANDDAGNAQSLEGVSGEGRGSNINATREAAAWDAVRFPSAAGRTVWWSWTAPGTGHVRLDTTASRSGTLLDVFRGTTPASLAWVAGCNGNCRELLAVEAGATYFLRLDNLPWDLPGELLFTWSWAQPPQWNKVERVQSAGGGWQLRAIGNGPAGRAYLLEASSDLSTWTEVPGITADNAGAITLAVPWDPAQPRAFYRLRERP